MHNPILGAINACIPDLEHYAATHGPGPDRRLRDLKDALQAEDAPKLRQRADGNWLVLDCPGTPLWYAVFLTEQDALNAWKIQFNKS